MVAIKFAKISNENKHSAGTGKMPSNAQTLRSKSSFQRESAFKAKLQIADICQNELTVHVYSEMCVGFE